MICRKCYTNNEEGAKFCVGCGEKLEEEIKQNVQENNMANNVQTENNYTQYSNMQNNNNQYQNTPNYNNTQYNQNVNNKAKNSGTPVYNMAGAIIAIVVSACCVLLTCCGIFTGLIGIAGIVLGILSLVQGSKVKKFVMQGNIQLAEATLKKAKTFNMIAWIITGITAGISILGFFIFVILGIFAEM